MFCHLIFTQSCMKVFCFNAQSCRQIATDIHDMIVDTNVDVLMLTETWLYSHGDEAYIAAMTPAGYDFRSFPRVGSRGGGVGFVMRTTLSTSLLFKPLDYRSCEAVEMRLSFDHVSVAIVCLYRPPPSKRNKLTNSMFLEEFSELLSQYASSRLRTMLSDHNLTQLVNVPTHKPAISWTGLWCAPRTAVSALTACRTTQICQNTKLSSARWLLRSPPRADVL